MTSIFDQKFDEMICGGCGVRYGAPEGYFDHRRKDGKTFYCPNGCPRHYRVTEADRIRQERDHLKQQLAQKDDEIAEAKRAAAAAEKKASTEKGKVTRLMNRAKAGVCPCCNRTFTNLARHMASKHKGEEGAAG